MIKVTVFKEVVVILSVGYLKFQIYSMALAILYVILRRKKFSLHVKAFAGFTYRCYRIWTLLQIRYVCYRYVIKRL